uniref:AT5G09995-like protein n=1 Tax=Arabidopsis arenosa TaxID=38785 RepID=B7U9U3_ARAAE|nr:AT5G09995-like protein [Arabidopsis arenosa]
MLFSPSNLQSPKPLIFWNPILHYGFIDKNLSFRRRDTLRLAFPISRFTKGSESIASSSPSPLYSNPQEPSISPQLTSSVGQPPLQLSQWTFTQKHFILLNVVACITAISASWLFFAAIPTLLAFKKAAESLEKLLDVTREELPDTMAAVRLSGMEISDLTMELSDLGQGITQGVKSSTRAIRVAEDRLRRLTNMNPASMQEVMHRTKTEETEPMVARKARSLKEGIVKGRSLWQLFSTITRFSKTTTSYLAKRAKQ